MNCEPRTKYAYCSHRIYDARLDTIEWPDASCCRKMPSNLAGQSKRQRTADVLAYLCSSYLRLIHTIYVIVALSMCIGQCRLFFIVAILYCHQDNSMQLELDIE